MERVHTAPHIGTYSVGQHSHGIIMLMLILHPNPTAKLLRAAAVHDIAERWTGDVPGYILRVDPLLKEQVKRAEHDHAMRVGFAMPPDLTDDEAAWLKALDTFELWLWCHDQIAFGNRHVEAIEEDVRVWLETSPAVPEAVRDAYRAFARKGWRRLRHADLPPLNEAPTIPPKPLFNAECPVCRDAGKKAHVGPCMTIIDELPPPHEPGRGPTSGCGCRVCEASVYKPSTTYTPPPGGNLEQ